MTTADDQYSGKWTVMVYMAGDNNLSDRCVDDVREMKLAGLSEDVTVRVQVDRSSAYGNTPARYKVSGCSWDELADPKCSISADKVEGWSHHYNTGRMEPLEDFIKWCINDRPNDKYMLVLWGHGSPLDNVAIPSPPKRTLSEHRRRRTHAEVSQRLKDDDAFFRICSDDYTGDSLTNIELREVLKRIRDYTKRPIDVLGLDACLMSMVELCYDLRHGANFIVASESLIPSTSWPYHWILNCLVRNPRMSPADLCRNIVARYIAYYADYDDVPVQLSACDLSKCQDLKDVVARLGELVSHGLRKNDIALRNAILSAHFRAQPYYEEQYYDLYDFCYMLKESCGKGYETIKSACSDVMNVVSNDHHTGFVLDSKFNEAETPQSEVDLQFSYGVSIYLPWAGVSERYKSLEFAKDAKWYDFLEVYTDQTAKEPRSERRSAEISCC